MSAHIYHSTERCTGCGSLTIVPSDTRRCFACVARDLAEAVAQAEAAAAQAAALPAAEPAEVVVEREDVAPVEAARPREISRIAGCGPVEILDVTVPADAPPTYCCSTCDRRLRPGTAAILARRLGDDVGEYDVAYCTRACRRRCVGPEAGASASSLPPLEELGIEQSIRVLRARYPFRDGAILYPEWS